jgi:hypothetical protein
MKRPAFLLQKANPRAMGERFIVPSIRRREIAPAHRSGVRHIEDSLRALDVGLTEGSAEFFNKVGQFGRIRTGHYICAEVTDSIFQPTMQAITA